MHHLVPYNYPNMGQVRPMIGLLHVPAPLSASLHTEEGARAPVAPRPTVQPSLTSDEPQKTGALTPDLRAAPSPHKTAAAAPFYEPPLHESTLLAPPTTSRGAPIVEPSARAPCAPAAPPPAGPPPAQGPAPPPLATATVVVPCGDQIPTSQCVS